MLKYFKYFAVVSFLLVLVAAFFVGAYFRLFVVDSIVKNSVENDTVLLAESFSDKIFCKYEPILKRLDSVPINQWQEDKLFHQFKRISLAVLEISTSTKTTLYTKNIQEILTTNDADIVLLGKDYDTLPSKDVINYDKTSEVIKKMGVYESDGSLNKGSYVRTIVTLDSQNCKKRKMSGDGVRIVLETFHEITHAWEQLYLFQLVVSAGIVGIFVLLYLALVFTSRRAERIINKQHEEKLRLEKEKTIAESQNQQKSMFLANVSHELRTPLNAIIGFSKIIMDESMGAVGHPQYKEYVTDINSSGIHLLSLINDILDYSKAEARKLDVEAVDIDLSKIATSCLRLVETRAKESKVTLAGNMPEKHVVMPADPKRMKQVILNLLSNAVKFTDEEGRVSLTIEEDQLNGIVKLTVADNGIGIAEKDISKAMSPFGQIDSSISRKYEGTGLGLPLTKKLVELMDGKFEIKSEAGLGTSITLTFSKVVEEKSTGETKF